MNVIFINCLKKIFNYSSVKEKTISEEIELLVTEDIIFDNMYEDEFNDYYAVIPSPFGGTNNPFVTYRTKANF